MSETPPYNPLDKRNLARSIETEVLSRPALPLRDVDQIIGAGIYVIYYSGPFPAYAPIAAENQGGNFGKPIYVGKAIPKGGRKGGLSKDAAVGRALADRLRQHASSIDEAKENRNPDENLDLDDFHVRHLVVEDIWIPLGENMLIETFRPVWNVVIDGFGNKDPGKRRATQYKSPWDVLHPGRKFAKKLANSGVKPAFLVSKIEAFLEGKPVVLIEDVDAEDIDVEDVE